MAIYYNNSNGDILMKASKILGILIIIALILSIAIVGVNSFILNKDKASGNTVSMIMKPDEIENITYADNNETNISELYVTVNESNIRPTININIHQKVGAVKIEFADTDDIYNVTTSNSNNASTTIKHSQTNETVTVDITSKSAGNTIVLSNKYRYNINAELLSGGINAELSPNSQIDTMGLNITLGGANINLNNAYINHLDNHVTVGGVNVNGIPHGYAHMDSEIKIGGLNLANNNQKVYVRSNIELGGYNAEGYQYNYFNGFNCLKGNAYDGSTEQFDITSKIQIGGLNIR